MKHDEWFLRTVLKPYSNNDENRLTNQGCFVANFAITALKTSAVVVYIEAMEVT